MLWSPQQRLTPLSFKSHDFGALHSLACIIFLLYNNFSTNRGPFVLLKYFVTITFIFYVCVSVSVCTPECGTCRGRRGCLIPRPAAIGSCNPPGVGDRNLTLVLRKDIMWSQLLSCLSSGHYCFLADFYIYRYLKDECKELLSVSKLLSWHTI